MWPLTGLEVVIACGGRCDHPALAELLIAGVTASPGAPDEIFAAIRDGDLDAHDWVAEALREGAPLAIVAATWPGLADLPAPLRDRCVLTDDPLRAIRRLAVHLRRTFSFPVIAVGGSNGKTTTKEMIAALLSGSGAVTKTPETMNGFSGVPITLAQRGHAASSPPRALVVEIGIDAVGAMADHAALVDPDVAVITALGPEHLDGLGSWDTAAAEELILFESSPRLRRVFQAKDDRIRAQLGSARRGDIIVCEEDDTIARSIARPGSGISVLSFRATSTSPLASDVDLVWSPDGVPIWRGRAHVPMAGRHNADNFAAAFGAGLAAGWTPDDLLAGWPSFTPPGMRCDAFPLAGGGLLIDDAYNASPSSMAAAIALVASPAFLGRRKVLILGDMLDLGADAAAFHLALVDPLSALAGAHLCLFGARMLDVHRALAARGVATSFLPSDADPRAFLDFPEVDFPGAVVLVKGSRGMGLERVTGEILGRSHRSTMDPIVHIGVVGTTRSRAVAAAIRARLDGLTPGHFAVTTLSDADLVGGALGRFSAGIFTDFDPDPATATESAEQALARMAQLFMALPEGGVAALPAGDPAADLLVEIVPAGVRVVRPGTPWDDEAAIRAVIEAIARRDH